MGDLVMGFGWAVIGGSATGKSHSATGSPCQDSHGWLISPDVTCLAVADGAGSRPLSGAGSEAAIRAVLECVRAAPPLGRPSVPELFSTARAALDELAAANGRSPDEYATTLAVALIDQINVSVGQVGDSIVVLRANDGETRAVAPPERFEYANETVFMTSRAWEEHFRLETFPEDVASCITLSTDGLRFKILDDLALGTPFTPFFDDIFDYLTTKEGSSLGVARFIDGLDDQSGDDKTLVIAAKVVATGGADLLVVNDFQVTGDQMVGRIDKDHASRPSESIERGP